jgi:hypothetical protein
MAMTPESAVLVPLFAGREYLKSTADIVLGRIEASHKDNGVARAWRVAQFFKDACRTPVGSAFVVGALSRHFAVPQQKCSGVFQMSVRLAPYPCRAT